MQRKKRRRERGEEGEEGSESEEDEDTEGIGEDGEEEEYFDLTIISPDKLPEIPGLQDILQSAGKKEIRHGSQVLPEIPPINIAKSRRGTVDRVKQKKKTKKQITKPLEDQKPEEIAKVVDPNLLPEYRQNARKLASDDIEKINEYHKNNVDKF